MARAASLTLASTHPAALAVHSGIVADTTRAEGVLTTMARLSQWALENGYLARGKDSSEPSGYQPEESGAAPGPRSNKG